MNLVGDFENRLAKHKKIGVKGQKNNKSDDKSCFRKQKNKPTRFSGKRSSLST